MPLDRTERKLLLELARASVTAAAAGKELPALPENLPPELCKDRGVFVTLTQRGRLRGCIGLMEACYPMAQAVIRMAAAAATQDPRFQPLASADLMSLEIEISVLSPLRRVGSAAEITVGRDGVLVRSGRRSGVFLPQVAEETGWDRERFLSELCANKAGLAPDAWRDPACELWTFTVEKITEK
jgi:AmmeMemoRadiSam system protein A